MAEVFPAKISLNKPTDYKLSAAMERMYDVWNPHEDAGNEFYSNFKYTWLEGFSRQPNVSRRDPSKVLRIEVGITSCFVQKRHPLGTRKRPIRFRLWTGI